MYKINWNEVEEVSGEFDRPAPGAYIGRICSVEDHTEKEFLKIEWDFAEGNYLNYNRDTSKRMGFWPMALFRSYKVNALGFFKAFKRALEESNPGYQFREEDLNDMVGRVVGIVLVEEEYRKKDGSKGKRLYVAQTRSIDAIRRGDFKVPGLKQLDPLTSPPPLTKPTYDIDDPDDDELPF